MATNHLTYSVITNRGVEVRARWVGTFELAVFDNDGGFQLEWTHNLEDAIDRFNQLVAQNTYTVRPLTLPEAMKIVSDNANKLAKHNYWDVYLPAIIMVNEAFPITGYVTVDDEWGGNNTTPQAQILSDWNDRRRE